MEWISIKDQLPRLASKECGGVCVRIYATLGSGHLNQDAVYTYYGRFVIENNNDITITVTHWMYIPSPPPTINYILYEVAT